MAEMPPTRKHHGQPMGIARIDYLLIPTRAARLYDGGDPSLRRAVNRIVKREKSIRRQHTALPA